MTGSEHTEPFVVLVADDNPESLQVVCTILTEAGYEVRVASDGFQVMAVLNEQPADLVLLDVHMPELDGYAVCQRMKGSPALANIPVVFLSALNDPFNKVQGFEVGAADFISKPFHATELLARVVVHLKIRNLQSELEKRNRDLEHQNKQQREHERSRELFTHMLVHDLRGPLQAVLSGLKFLSADQTLSPNSQSLIENALLGCCSISRLVGSILDVALFEAGQLKIVAKPIDLKVRVENAIQSLAGLAKLRKTLCRQNGEVPFVDCDSALIDRVLVNLLDNAYKYSDETSPVEVLLSADEQWLKVEVRDFGQGIPLQLRHRIFEKFNFLDIGSQGQRNSIGLGLAYCKMAIEAHGGNISIDSDTDSRTTFAFTLPLVSPAAQQAVG